MCAAPWQIFQPGQTGSMIELYGNTWRTLVCGCRGRGIAWTGSNHPCAGVPARSVPAHQRHPALSGPPSSGEQPAWHPPARRRHRRVAFWALSGGPRSAHRRGLDHGGGRAGALGLCGLRGRLHHRGADRRTGAFDRQKIGRLRPVCGFDRRCAPRSHRSGEVPKKPGLCRQSAM